MKRTENISLAGYAFTIEEDAYIELENYIKDIRAGFEGNSSADEITADIEERIAELLCERCASGIVVNLSMVEDIRKRIGNPKELAGEEVGDDTEGTGKAQEVKEEKRSWKNRKIYRNIDERILGGVCGGLGAYFGIDKVIFRVLFLIFFLVGFSDEGLFCIPMVLYICLWIAMPAARTVEQKCEMKGKPIDLKGFSSKEFDLNREMKEVASSPAGRTFKRAGGAFLGLILLTCGIAGLLCSIFIPTIPTVIDKYIDAQYVGIMTDSTLWGLILTISVIGFVGMLYGGIMLAFDLKSPSWKPGLVMFIAWILSILVTAAWAAKLLAEMLPGMIV